MIVAVRNNNFLVISDTSQMVAQLAHDIRSPLSALNTLAEVCKAQLPEEARTLMISAIKRINSIANDLLSIQRTRTTFNLKTFYKSVDTKPKALAPLICEIIDEKRLTLDRKQQIEFNINLAQAHDCIVTAHSCDIQRMLSNIVNNSIEAIGEKGGKIEILNLKTDQYLQIQIKDNGKGIPQHILSQIGIRGFTYGKSSGNGLGLSHAIDLMKKLNGKFEIKSTEGVGTTITLSFPFEASK